MAEPWAVHTLIFDLDDTLYLERDFVLSGFAAVGAWLEREHRVTGFAAKAAELFGAGRRGRIFDEAMLALGATAAIPSLVEAYRAHMPVIQLAEDAVEILDWARPRFRLGVLTDGYLEVQRRKVRALDLERWRPHIVFSDEWGRAAWKPSHRPFEEIMRRSPGVPGGYVYIADNPRKDFIAPRALGWRSVRIRRPGGEHELYVASGHEAAEVEISRLSELRGIVTATQ